MLLKTSSTTSFKLHCYHGYVNSCLAHNFKLRYFYHVNNLIPFQRYIILYDCDLFFKRPEMCSKFKIASKIQNGRYTVSQTSNCSNQINVCIINAPCAIIYINKFNK